MQRAPYHLALAPHLPRGYTAVMSTIRRVSPEEARELVDEEGYLVAAGDFSAPVGPTFWDAGVED